MPSTPPPQAELELPLTPSAPRFGTYHDDWTAHRPRKSARISAQHREARTPSPRRKSKTICTPPSTERTSKKEHRAGGALRNPFVANKAGQASLDNGAGLATPSKTPRGKQAVLDDTPLKRRSKKYSGMTLESFRAEEDEAGIEIFTDSKERIPEKDSGIENPFQGSFAPPAPRKQKGKVFVPGEGMLAVEQAVGRDDGFVCNFRGKAIFRKYEDDAGEPVSRSPSSTQFASSVGPRRQLFAKVAAPLQSYLVDDEEAVTDIEDVNDEEAETDVEDDVAHVEKPVQQASIRSFATISNGFTAPSSSSRSVEITTTSVAPAQQNAPAKASGKKHSIFDAFKVTKQRQTRSSAKRKGDSIDSNQAKRARTLSNAADE